MKWFKQCLTATILAGVLAIPIATTASAAEVTGNVSVSVTANTPTIKPNAISMVYTGGAVPASLITGTAYNSWHNNDANWAVAGTWSWVDAAPTTVGTYTKTVKFTPSNTTNYNATTASVSVTITKATPTVSNLSAAGITYGQALSASRINGTANVAGSFSWVSPTTKPAAGTQSYAVKFTPTDTTNYNPVTKNVSIAVGKASQTLDIGGNRSVFYGTASAALAVSGSRVGAASWTSSNTAVASVSNGTITYGTVGTATVTCTYSGDANHNPITKSITITVNKATPTISGGSASAITYGQQLSTSAITPGTATNPNNGANVVGSWAWVDGSIVPNAGTTAYTVTFTPTDATHYNNITTNINVLVNKAAQNPFVGLTDINVMFGVGPTSKAFNGVGTLTVSSSDTGVVSVTKSGDSGIVLTFTGAGTSVVSCSYSGNENYNPATSSLTVNVTKNTPTVEIRHDDNLLYGNTIEDFNISTTKQVNSVNVSLVCDGTVAFDNPTSILDTGTHNVGWTFTPTNTQSYNQVTGTTQITVVKHDPCVIDDNPFISTSNLKATAIVQGEPLSYSNISGSVRNVISGRPIEGTFRWATTSVIPEFSDSEITPYQIIFTPTDAVNYSVMTSHCTVKVDQRTPIISNVTYSIARAGNTLDSLRVASTGTDPITIVGINGDTAWASNDVMTVGTRLYSIAYTADDTVLYQTAYTNVAVSVVPKLENPITTRLDNYTIKYSPNATFNLDAHANTTLTYTSNNPELFSVSSDGTVTVLSRGEGSITISAYEDATYSANNKIVNVLVEKGDYNPTITASTIKYGQSISASVLTATNGTANWVSTLDTSTILTPGEYTYNATWVPADSNLYNPTEAAVTLKVVKATVVPSIDTFTASLYYNQSVRVNQDTYTFTSAVTGASVTGTFKYNDTEEKCSTIGESYCNFTFTANPSGCYEPYKGKIKITGVKQTPDITMSTVSVTYGTRLSEIPPFVRAYDTVTGNEIPITVTWEEPSMVPTVGSNNCTVIVTPTDSDHYMTKSYACVVEVTQKRATLTDIAAHDISYGQTLADSEFAYMSDVDGKIVWDVPATKPVAGIHEYTAKFVPNDTINYATIALNVQVNVNRSIPKIATASLQQLTYGQLLSELSVTYTCSNPFTGDLVHGTWAWETPDVVPTVAPQSFTAIFTPQNTSNYSITSTVITVPVTKANPAVTIKAQDITFGDDLSKSLLTVEGQSGTASWEDPTIIPDVSDSESTEYNVIFRPSDSANYNTVTVPTRVKVNKKLPRLSEVSASGITYGQRLADSTLTYTSDVTGTLSWERPSTVPSVADAGVTNYACIFVPDDTDNYENVKMGMALDVSKCIPRITTNEIRTATYGEKLSDIAITYTASNDYLGCNVPGTWTWEYPDKLPTVATQSYNAIFTPRDTVNYAVTSTGIRVNVVKGNPRVTLTTPEMAYGVTLREIPITVSGTPGIASWVNDDIIPTVLDSETTEYDVVFVPDDTNNFNTISLTLTVHINKQDVKNAVDLSVLGATDVIYGDKLSASTITGIENLSVPGTVEWINPDEMPNADNNDIRGYQALYTPNDTVNYVTSTIEIMVHVEPRVVNYSNVKATDLTYGQHLSEAEITGDTDISGTWAFANQSHIPTVTEYESGALYEVIFTPSDDGNYTETRTSIPVKVTAAPPEWHSDIVHSISASPITYGQQLAESTITGDIPVPGYYEWIRPTAKPTVMDSDTTTFGVRFVSTDPNYTNFEGLYCTVHVNTFSYTADDFTDMNASGITYGQTLDSSTITGTGPIPGKFVWKDGTIKPSVADSNATIYYATFIPKDSIDYAYVTDIPVKVSVSKTNVTFSPAELGTFKTSTITYPNPLSTSTISGVTNIPGHFEWVNGSIVPNVDDTGKKTFRAVFIPDDNNYVSKEIDLYVTVVAQTIEPEDFRDVKADSLTYGTKLEDVKITGVSPIPGKFTWSTPNVIPSVSDSGRTEYTIVFTPEDNNYNKVEFKVKLVVNPATLDFGNISSVLVSGSSITYGQKLSESALTGEMPVPGKFEWVAPDTVPTVKDSSTTAYAVRFVPDSNNYTTVNNLTARINVVKKSYSASDFSNLKATSIEYGDALSTSTITANAPIPGKFAWNKPSYVPIRNDSGKTEFAVTFVPTDFANYEAVSLTCTVTVTDKELEFTQDIINSIKASRITYGQQLSDSIITGKTPCSGRYEWVDGNIKPSVSDSDNTKYKVRFVSKDANYNDVENLSITITVDKCTVSTADITSITATPIAVGQSLANSKLSGATNIPGKFEWDNPAIIPTVSDSGKTKYGITFTPTDTTNYTSLTGLSASVKIGLVTPDISDIKLKASDIAFGESLANSAISGKLPTNPTTKEEIPGQYRWVDETIKPAVSDSKITAYKVVFIPTDTVSYTKSAETTLKLNIVRNNPTIDVSDIVVNFGSGPVTLSAKSNSTGAISFSTTDTSVITIKNGVATVVGIGEADVLVKVAQTSSYNEGSKLFKFVVNASSTRISGKTSYTVKFGEPSFYLDAKAEVASIPLSYKVTSGNSVKVDKDGLVTPLRDGTSVITVSAESNGYGLGDFNVTVTVTRVPATISTLGNINKVWGDPDFKLEVSTNSTSAVTFTSSNTNVITVSGNTAHITGVGQANILASCEPGSGYEGASTTFYINVVKATPVVQSVGIYKKTLNSAPFKVTDGIISNGDRTYTSSNSSVATVSRDGTVTVLREGDCEIRVVSAATTTMEQAMQVINVNVSNDNDDQDDPGKPDPTDETEEPDDPNKPDPTKPDDPASTTTGNGNGDGDVDPVDKNPDDNDDDIGMIDTDGDGIPDTPFDPNKDTDGDGIPDIYDDDIDGDGIPNDLDDDVDGDGIPNEDDPDYWALMAYLDGLTYTLPAGVTIPDDPNAANGNSTNDVNVPDDGNGSTIPWLIIIIVCAVVVVAGGIVTVIIIKKHKK